MAGWIQAGSPEAVFLMVFVNERKLTARLSAGRSCNLCSHLLDSPLTGWAVGVLRHNVVWFRGLQSLDCSRLRKFFVCQPFATIQQRSNLVSVAVVLLSRGGNASLSS